MSITIGGKKMTIETGRFAWIQLHQGAGMTEISNGFASVIMCAITSDTKDDTIEIIDEPGRNGTYHRVKHYLKGSFGDIERDVRGAYELADGSWLIRATTEDICYNHNGTFWAREMDTDSRECPNAGDDKLDFDEAYKLAGNVTSAGTGDDATDAIAAGLVEQIGF